MITTIKSGNTNCHILSNEIMESYILVDTGTIQDKNFIDKLKAAGKLSKIGLLISTHGHHDHIGCTSFLRENFDIPITMHHKDNDKVSCDSMDSPPAKGFLSGIIRSLTIRDNQTTTYPKFESDIALNSSLQIEGFPETRMLYLSGHTQGSIGVIFENNLLAGSLVVNTFLPSVIRFVEDFSLVRESIHSIYETSFVRIRPGYGSSFPGEPLKKLL